VIIVCSTELDADPDRTWRVLTDWERQASWMPDVAWVRPIGPERGLGAYLEIRTKIFGIPLLTDRARVIVWEPPTRLAIEHLGLVVGAGEWQLRRLNGNRTRLTWTERIRLAPAVVGDLALWLYGPVQRWMIKRSLRNLVELIVDQGG